MENISTRQECPTLTTPAVVSPPMILARVQVNERSLIQAAVHGARPRKVSTVRWAVVRDLFAITSTMAYALCQEFKLDPEEKLTP